MKKKRKEKQQRRGRRAKRENNKKKNKWRDVLFYVWFQHKLFHEPLRANIWFLNAGKCRNVQQYIKKEDQRGRIIRITNKRNNHKKS